MNYGQCLVVIGVLAIAGCGGPVDESPIGCGTSSRFMVQRTIGGLNVDDVTVSGACTPHYDWGGGSPHGYFTQTGGECLVTVRVPGHGQCSTQIIEAGCDYWVEVMVGFDEAGALSCDVETIYIDPNDIPM